MKRVLKLIGITSLAVISIVLLCACSTKYADLPVADITAKIDEAIDDDGSLAQVDSDYIKYYLGLDEDAYEECAVKVNVKGVNINEYGVFKAKDEAQAKAIGETIDEYLVMRNETYMPEYKPEEKPKIEASEYKTFGNYVVYLILWDEEKEAAFGAVENAIKG